MAQNENTATVKPPETKNKAKPILIEGEDYTVVSRSDSTWKIEMFFSFSEISENNLSLRLKDVKDQLIEQHNLPKNSFQYKGLLDKKITDTGVFVVVGLEKVSADKTTSAEQQAEIKDNLGQTLVRKGLVEPEIIEKALAIKEKENDEQVPVYDRRGRRNLAQILVEDFHIDHDVVFKVVATQYGFREINLADENINEHRIEFIQKMMEPLPESIQEYMLNNKILAFRYDHDRPYKLVLVAADPTDRAIPEIVRSLGVKSYEVCYVKLQDIKVLLESVFQPENEFLKVLGEEDMDMPQEEIEDQGLDEESIEAEINKSLLVNLVEGMLVEAVRMDCSDIHVIPVDGKTTNIMFRVDGDLRIWRTQQGVRPEAITAVVKDRSKNIDRFERDRAQDGFIQRKIAGHNIRYRVSVIPIVGSEYHHKFESTVIRILDDRKVITDLDKLGFQGSAKESFIQAISKPSGMIIVTGPTGSGKSTTLIAALSYILRPEINVLTVEDPVEYIIGGARQLKISPKMDFELALRAVLRHDPDVVMVGEIRDKETGEIGIKMANTGHLTFSTLHTNDAASAVSRLYKMGIETFLIAYAINIVIAQRLVRKLCSECKKPIENLDPAIPLGLGFTEKEVKETTFYEPAGCDKCNNGYKGRAAIHEALYFSKEIRRKIFSSAHDINEEEIKDLAVSQGMLTLRAACRERVKQGLTSMSELIHVTAED